MTVDQTIGVNSREVRVRLDAEKSFDTLELVIDPADVSGSGFLGVKAPVIGDIEVIAQVSREGLTWSFLRGDATGDLRHDITDAQVVLDSLFLGTGRLPCDASADTNGDGAVNLSDPVALLHYMFLGGDTPPEPFTKCGPGPAGDLVCDRETCR